MLSCINKNSKQFRDLVQISGLSEFNVEAYCRYYLDKFGRFPYLDELPNSNSEPYLRKELNITSNNVTTIDKLLKFTGGSDLESSIIQLNNKFRDLEISGVDLNNNVILDIQHKPKDFVEEFYPQDEITNNHGNIILDDFCTKLQQLYGINIVPITTQEINTNPNLKSIPNIYVAKAFILNNTIYINTDNSSVDSKVHELLHLLFATMRDINPELYFNLIEKAQNFSNFELVARNYPDRTMGDLLEEVFVTELGRHLAGLESSLSELSETEYNEIHYQITRILDILLEGEISSRCVPEDTLYDLSFGNLGMLVNSKITSYKFMGSLDNTKIHRMLANTKSKLLKENKLKEICE